MFWDLHRTLFPGGIPHVEEIFVNIGVFVYLLSIFHHVHPGVYMYRFILRFVFAQTPSVHDYTHVLVVVRTCIHTNFVLQHKLINWSCIINFEM